MAKRIPIPEDISTELLYISDKTCCKCHRPNIPVQIHHIDENPSNNNIENLAVLCLDCHDETQIKGGFGRGLSKKLVKKYRDEWHKEVSLLRQKAHENRLNMQLGKSSFENKNEYSLNDVFSLYIMSRIDLYINTLEDYKRNNELNTTIDMMNYNYFISESIIELLRDMSQFLDDAFKSSCILNIEDKKDYFDSLFTLAYEWSRFTNDTNGTISKIIVGSSANDILKKFASNLMSSLFPWEGNAEQIDKIIQRFQSSE